MNRLLLLLSILVFSTQSNATNFPHFYPLNDCLSSPLADSLPPAINCPPSATYNLQPSKCDTVLNYSVVAYDNLPGFTVTQLSGLPTQSAFPTGVHVNSFRVTDAAGNTASCSFTITVNDYNFALICDDLTVVELDEDCTAVPTWDMILENEVIGCPDNFIVQVDITLPLGNGPWVTPFFPASDINKTFAVRVIHDSDNDNIPEQNEGICWGNIMIKDNLGPTLICQDVTVPCEVSPVTPEFLFDSLGIANAYPIISDNCGTVTDTSYISMLDFVDVYDPVTQVLKFTRRIWNATDASGNKSSCEQYINQVKSSVSDVFFPADVTLECTDTTVSTPAVTGIPYIEVAGHFFPLSACAMVFTYTDSLGNACGLSERIFRTWYLLDSETSQERSWVQYIEIQDVKPPEIACPEALTLTVDANNCRATVSLPDAEITDACSGIATFRARWMQADSIRNWNGTIVPFPGNEMALNDRLGTFDDVPQFPVGITSITYTAADACGNTNTCQWTLTVLDGSAPVAICKSLVKVALGPNGQLTLPAASLDGGSNDACVPVRFKTKMNTPGACADNTSWDDHLQLCCGDQEDTLTVLLRVYDIELDAGVIDDSFGEGRFSECTARVVVTDTFPALCDNLPDMTVSCADFDPTFDSYGQFPISCSVDSFYTQIDYSLFDTVCHVGSITRTFNIVYGTGQTGFCLQNLYFEPADQHYYVRFPDDVTVTTCTADELYGTPQIFKAPGSCDNIDITYVDQIMNIVPDACFGIQRTWFIRNLCHYDDVLPLTMIPNPQVNTGPVVSAPGTTGAWAPTALYENLWSANTNGYFYVQRIRVRDMVAPFAVNCMPTAAYQDSSNNNNQLWNEPYWMDNDLQTNDLCEGAVHLSVTAKDACTDGQELKIRYLLFLDLDNDDYRETVVHSQNFPGYNGIFYNNYSTPNYSGGTLRQFDERPVPANQKWGFALEVERTDSNVTAYVRFNTLQSPQSFVDPQLPYGNHRIRWIFEDKCGNEGVCDQDFTIRDGKAPDIVCPDSITVYFEDQPGVTTMSLSEVLWSVADNCSPANMVVKGMRLSGTGTGFPPDPAPQTIDFHCIPDANTTRKVEAWVQDVAGNNRFCEVTIQVDSCNLPLPEQAGHIIGKVTTPNELAIPDVSLLAYITNTTSNTTLSDTTNIDGDYDIPVEASLGMQYIGGQASVLPRKNTNPLNGVSTYDLLLISRHILGLDTLDSPYKIIAADANKSGMVTSFDIVELRKLILGYTDNLASNTSWRFVQKDYVFPDPTNPFQPPFPESDTSSYFLNGGTFNFIGIKVGDVDMSVNPQNANAELSERSDRTLPVQTMQRELTEGETFTATFQTTQPSLGLQFTMSYQNLELLDILPEKGISADQFAHFPQENAFTMACENTRPVTFSVRFRVLKSGALCDYLSLGSRITPAAAWLPGEHNKTAVAQVALAFTDSKGFALLQNQPNPFGDQTTIRFQLPAASEATLTIFDGKGRQVFKQTGFYEKGLQAVPVDLSGAPEGVLYYQVETPEYRAVDKMVRMK